MTDNLARREPPPRERALSAYLLGTLDFDQFLSLQRRLVYEIGGRPDAAALLLCSHPPGITIGREGSRRHIRPSREELAARGWPVRWVSRGGGAVLHQSGQVACYPIVSLAALGLTPAAYVGALQQVAVELVRDYGVAASAAEDHPGVLVNGRGIVQIGVAVRGDVGCFGLVVNADPDLADFREVHCDGHSQPMTSLARESPLRVRLAGVRQCLLDLIAAKFEFNRVSVFHTHPWALPRPSHYAVANRA